VRIVDAIYRELRFELAGTGGSLEGLVAQDHIKLDRRSTVSSARAESDYPWIIFLWSESSEDNRVRYVREKIEIALIGLQSSPTRGDALLEEMRVALIDHFAGKRRRWGKFDEDGAADPDGGLLMGCEYVSTAEAFDGNLEEKMHILSFTFTRVR